MQKKLIAISFLLLLSVTLLAGCDTADTSDEIEFTLPLSSDGIIASYIVELTAPFTKESLGVQEGLPGETLVFELDSKRVYVNAIVTALDADGNELDTTQAMVVDWEWVSPGCEITAESSFLVDTARTKVTLDVNCYGVAFDSNYNDQNGEFEYDFNLNL